MKSFLEGKKVISTGALSPPKANSLQSISPIKRSAEPAAKSARSVEVVKEGDRIVRLIITCACGEKTEVDCLYPLGG